MAWGQQEEEVADKKLRRSRRLKDPVAAGALLAEMLATDPDHALDSLFTAKAPRHTSAPRENPADLSQKLFRIF